MMVTVIQFKISALSFYRCFYLRQKRIDNGFSKKGSPIRELLKCTLRFIQLLINAESQNYEEFLVAIASQASNSGRIIYYNWIENVSLNTQLSI